MKRYIKKKLILTNEDRVLKSIREAIDTIDNTCVSHDGQKLDVWMTEPGESDLGIMDNSVKNNDDPSVFYVTIAGGKNGGGIWSNYFAALNELLIKLEDTFEDVCVINIINDVVDDVFYVRLSILQDFGDIKPYFKYDSKEVKESDDEYMKEQLDRIVKSRRIREL